MSERPLISLCMIVKNEEKNLPRCLDSVKGVVDEMIIVDTGSSDKTKEIASSYGAKVYDFEWMNDFAAARNYGLDKATGKWILVLDADEELENSTKNSLRAILEESSVDAYECVWRNIMALTPEIEYKDSEMGGFIRVFRNKQEYRFRSMYHEAVFPAIYENQGKIEEKQQIIIIHYGLLSDTVQGGERTRNDRAFYYLTKALEQEPDNGHLQFYLGVEYYNRKDYQNAYRILKHVVLETNTKFASVDQTKKGLLILSDLALQRKEYDLAYGCARGCLSIQLFEKLNEKALNLYAESLFCILKQFDKQLPKLKGHQRLQMIRQRDSLISEFEKELSKSQSFVELSKTIEWQNSLRKYKRS